MAVRKKKYNKSLRGSASSQVVNEIMREKKETFSSRVMKEAQWPRPGQNGSGVFAASVG
jgi:hypothetical protein